MASQFARQLRNYNHFVRSIKYISTDLKGVLMVIIHMFMLIYQGEITIIGVMRGRKGERHCKTTWFYEMEKIFFLQFCCVHNCMWILLN